MTAETSNQQEDSFFSGENEASTDWFKFIEIGDKIKGELLGSFDKPPEGKFGAQKVYEIRTADKNVWNVGIPITKTKVLETMSRVRIGQDVGLKYVADWTTPEREVQKLSPAKTIKVYYDKNYDPVETLMNEANGSVETSTSNPDVPPLPPEAIPPMV